MEYTVVGFAPVILAAVSATAVTHVVYGDAPAFVVPPLTLASLWELPYVLGMGLAIGVLAAAFMRSSARPRVVPRPGRSGPAPCSRDADGRVRSPGATDYGHRLRHCGRDLLGNFPLTVLLAIVAFKLLATGAAIGLGIPGGLIGPVIVIGATAGGALGVLGQWLAPITVSSPAFYALIGVWAMMAGTLHAPLAALTAMLEFTGNPHIIWPGMLATIAAYGVSRVIFGQQPVFVALMRARGLDYRNDPIVQSLRRVSVGAAMDLSVAGLPRRAARAEIDAALARNPLWVLVLGSIGPEALLPAMDLVRQTMERPDAEAFDLLDLPAGRLQLAPIPLEATLQEALDAMDASGAEALYIARPPASAMTQAYGVVTRADIDTNYRFAR